MPPVEHMKTSLDHLPDDKQAELARVQEVLFAEFDDALAAATSARKKAGRILKIILFGSFARDDWVDERGKTKKGYQSDYDILVVVNQKELTDVATYWYAAQQRLLREIPRPVGLIYHTIAEVNAKLAEHRYFFTDIVKEGIALYEVPGHPLTEPGPLTPQQALERAEEDFEDHFDAGVGHLDTYEYTCSKGRLKEAAFNLHQSVENMYSAYLLATTFYSPNTNNIDFLRSLAEDRDARFREIWPDENKFQRRSFQRLKDAYVKARYSKYYEITRDELAYLSERAGALRDLVKAVCEARIAELREAASTS